MLWAPSSPLYQSPILKVPFLVVSSALLHGTYTPPNPPPSPTEAAKYGPKRDALSRQTAVRAVGFTTKYLFWTYTLCESAVVIANKYPSDVSSTILDWLVRKGYSASSVRSTAVTLAGCACLCIGPLIRMAAIRELGRFFTWELSIKKDQHLVTTGPYAIVRHPAYVGNLFMLTGTILCHFGPGSWYREAGWLDTDGGKALAAAWLALVAWVPAMMMFRLKKEDDVLRAQFPAEWERWAKKTPYKIIPFIY